MNLSKSTINMGSYSDTEFEAYFQNLKDELSVFNLQAKHDASTNSPGTINEYWIRVLTPVKSIVQEGVDYNYSRNPIYSGVAIVQSIRSEASEKIDSLEKDRNDKEKKLLPLQNEQKNLKEKCKLGISSFFRVFISALFGGCETVLTFNMVLTNSIPAVTAFFLALLTGLVTAFGLHFGANYISKATSLPQRRKRYFTVLLMAFIFAFALGMWRAESYQNASDINSQIDLQSQASSSAQTSLWPFVIISFASFIIGLSIELKFWLSDKERKDLKNYEEKTEEVKKAEHALQELNMEIEGVRAKSNAESASIMNKHEVAVANEYRLVTLAKNVISQYESINTDLRKDKQCPPFFGQPVDLGFKLYFNNLFNSLNNKQ